MDEAASKVRLSVYIVSPKVKELEEKITALEQEIEEAIKCELLLQSTEVPLLLKMVLKYSMRLLLLLHLLHQ